MSSWDTAPLAPTAAPAWQQAPEVGPTAEGAPFRVRLAVGTARERDRLATIQHFYPDAKPYGDSNFVYTDEGGQRRLYNPHGFDVGDLPAVTREAAETLGGAAGAITGMATGGPVPAMAGAGLGVAGADKAVDVARQAFGMPQTPSMSDLPKDALAGVLGEGGGQAIGRGAGQFLARTMTNPAAPQILHAAEQIRVRPTAGMVGRGPVSTVQTALDRVLPGAPTDTVRQANAARIQSFTEGTIPGALPANMQDAKQMAADAIRSAAQRRVTAFKNLRDRADNQFLAQMPAGAAFDINGVRQMAVDLQAKIATAPTTFGKTLAGPLATVKGIIADADANGGQLPIDTMRKLRTLVGQSLDDATVAQHLGMDQQSTKQLYGALKGDIRDAAQAVSPRAAELLNRHDQLVQAFRSSDAGEETIAGSIDKILRNGIDENLYSALKAGGANRIQNVMAKATPAEQQALGRMALEDISKGPTTHEFDINRLVREWDKMAPSTRNALFGKTMNTQDMEYLMNVLRPMREADRLRNFSNTAYSGAQIAGLAGIAGGLGAVATTGSPAALASAVAPVAGGYSLSWLMAQPGVARWMASTMRAGGPRAMPEGMTQQLRAAAIREGVDGQ